MFYRLLAIAFTLFANNSYALDCNELRYAFDIGSGAVKTTSMLVNKCTNKIMERLGEHNFHLKYQSCIEDVEGKKNLTKECFDKTKELFTQFETIYGTNCLKSKCSGIATAWARKANNSADMLKIYEESGVKVKVLSQYEEGQVGYLTAYTHPDAHETSGDALVWDIGGGSYQLTVKNADTGFHVYKGIYGVESYDTTLRSKIKIDGYLTEEQINIAVKLFASEIAARLAKDEVILGKIKSRQITKVLGIGRPMYMGIKEDLNLESRVTKEDLYNVAKSFSGKTRQEVRLMYPLIPDHYINQAQSALILVYSVMQELGIDEIYILDAKGTDFISINPEYWN